MDQGKFSILSKNRKFISVSVLKTGSYTIFITFEDAANCNLIVTVPSHNVGLNAYGVGGFKPITGH